MASPAPNKRIRFGLFDSGVGGLSVLRRLHQLAAACPDNTFEFVYLGDTARCPYGNRAPEQIREFISEIVHFLASKEVNHIVMACNTSAAVGLDHARKISPVPVHDIISPTAKYTATNFKRIGVMATQSTANSNAFLQRINYYAPEAAVFELGCPKLVPLVEAGDVYSERTKAILMEYTSKLEEQEVEAIVLGCTHFPFLQKAIQDLLAPSVILLDPAEMLAHQIISDLSLNVNQQTIAESISGTDRRCVNAIYTTGSASVFASTAAVCLGRNQSLLVEPDSVSHIPLAALTGFEQQANSQEAGAPPVSVSNVISLPSLKTALATDSKMVQA